MTNFLLILILICLLGGEEIILGALGWVIVITIITLIILTPLLFTAYVATGGLFAVLIVIGALGLIVICALSYKNNKE